MQEKCTAFRLYVYIKEIYKSALLIIEVEKCNCGEMTRLSGKVILFALAVVLWLPVSQAHAARTTVVLSVSIGGSVVVGAVAWYVYIFYS